jgi:hypothetical protein
VATLLARASSRSAQTTRLAPSAAKRWASALPMPFAAPVTTTILSLMSTFASDFGLSV